MKKLWLVETDNFQDIIILVGIDFDFLFGFNFRWLSGFQCSPYSCTCIYKIMTYVGPIHSSPKEKLVQYIRRMYSRWHSHSFPQSVLTYLAYAIMVSVPAEGDNIHIWHTSSLIPQVALTHLTLRGQRCIRYKNVFTSCVNDHKTFTCLHTP
jgi:hypothetical protein